MYVYMCSSLILLYFLFLFRFLTILISQKKMSLLPKLKKILKFPLKSYINNLCHKTLQNYNTICLKM